MKIVPVIVLALLCQFSHSAYAGAIQLPRTGQTISYASGDDGSLQKGVAASGLRFSANANGTVTDNLSGLIWLENANCDFNNNANEPDNQTWSAALGTARSLSSGNCGLTDGSKAGDWRLPNVTELESLVDLARSGPALPAGHPFGGVLKRVYWTSTTNAALSGSSWTINLDSGLLLDYDKQLSYNVWPVRNEPAGGIQYQLGYIAAGAGSGTITSNPAGISCTANCSAIFDANAQVTLIPTLGFDSYFAGWSGGGCSGSGNCVVTMNSAITTTATFAVHQPVNLGNSYQALINDAYAAAVNGNVINIRAAELTESPVFNRPAKITLKGGFDGTFSSNSGYTTLHGVLKISAGSVTIEKIVIR